MTKPNKFFKKYQKCTDILKVKSRVKISRSHVKNINNQFSRTFFSKNMGEFACLVNENARGTVNPYDKMEHVCQGISRVYKAGTFYIYNQYPMMKVKSKDFARSSEIKMNATFKLSRRKRVIEEGSMHV